MKQNGSTSKARLQAGFAREVGNRLKPLTARLTSVLTKLIEHEYPGDFWQLDFEVHDQGSFESGFPVRVYFYRRGYDQVFEDDRDAPHYPFRVPRSLLRIRNVYPAALVKRFTLSGDDYWHDQVAADTLVPWFSRCWQKAGGRKFPFRARIAAHDTARRLDLMSGRWVRDR